MGKHGSLKAYLSDLGLLGSTDRHAIDEAKKAYRREYMRRYKRQRRKRVREVVLSIHATEYRRIGREAHKHGMTVPVFLSTMIDTYCRKIPMTQHPDTIGELKTMVAKAFLKTEGYSSHEQLEALAMIERKLEELSSPKQLEDYLTKLLDGDTREDVLELLQKLITYYRTP